MKRNWEQELTWVINAVLLAAFSYAIWLTVLPLLIPPSSAFLRAVAAMIGIGAALFSRDFSNFKAVPEFKPLLLGGLILPFWPLARIFVMPLVNRK
ncbi:hypothetical protein [Zhongshania sp. BJYM1]|uniref:hypothetical protein n=1 Tax=Zhongshania aquatica TaxID=2965069 RepID=UPI0022B4ECB4|nr:hypothetical protein [Marortus sp. BJYM1]